MHFFLQIIFLHILNYFAITAPLSCIVPYLLSIYCMQAREKHSFGSNFHVIHFLPKSNIYLKTTLNILTMPITSGRLIFYDYQVDLLKRLFTLWKIYCSHCLAWGNLSIVSVSVAIKYHCSCLRMCFPFCLSESWQKPLQEKTQT